MSLALRPSCGRRVAVDHEVDARALHLHVVGHVLHFRQRRDGGLEPRRPVVERRGVGALHRERVRAVAHAAADLNRRRQAHERAKAREPEQLRTNLLRDLAGRQRALTPRRELQVESRLIHRPEAAAGAGEERVDVLVARSGSRRFDST